MMDWEQQRISDSFDKKLEQLIKKFNNSQPYFFITKPSKKVEQIELNNERRTED